MRLTCPNCDAQYEVDAAVIPDTGRDVQCSSCGTTWFQEPEGNAVVADPAPAAVVAPETDSADAPAAAPKGRERELRQRSLDDAVVNVLREEAERETQARRVEHSLLEEQDELGLGAAPATEAAVAVVIKDAPGAVDDGPDADEHLVSRNMRRDLLPDIEEINSTLRASSDRPGDPAARDVPETPSQRRSGFRRGFLSAVTVMVLALLPYLLADTIAARVPALAPAVAGYSNVINGLRTWLDGHMKSTTDSLRPAATSSSAS